LAGKVYKDDVGVQIRVNTGIDLTSATTVSLFISKPNGQNTTWTPTKEQPYTSGILVYTTMQGDLNAAGTYKLQAYVKFSESQILYGETGSFQVYDRWK
jgi:hypothetical protein